MPLDKENKSHRDKSNKLDAFFSNRTSVEQEVWKRFARPPIHGVYHAKNYVKGGNPEEWARAKDQFSKVDIIFFIPN